MTDFQIIHVIRIFASTFTVPPCLSILEKINPTESVARMVHAKKHRCQQNRYSTALKRMDNIVLNLLPTTAGDFYSGMDAFKRLQS